MGFFLPKFQNHLCLLIYDQDFSEFWICLELTKHNIWISIQGGRLIWKLFNAPGPQWDQIEDHFSYELSANELETCGLNFS